MARTEYISPTSISQFHDSEKDIAWTHSDDAISKTTYAVSAEPLHTIPGLWQEIYASRTNQLICTGFNFNLVGTGVQGIEVQVGSIRLARIQDYIIQLTLNGELIGDNLADGNIQDLKIFGSNSSLWGTNLTIDNINDPTFGIVVAFRSHVSIPHRDLIYVDQIAMRITYA